MALDVGEKTVGVAISDELGITAQGLTTVRRSRIRADLQALSEIAQAHEVGQLIVGLPLNMNGTEGPRARASRQLGDALANHLKVPAEYWDERLTTVAAQRALLEANVSRQKRKQVVDRLAATLILQSWLDHQNPRSGDG